MNMVIPYIHFNSILQLLEYEPRAAEQVPLLMTMRDLRLALTKAIESGDTDLGKDASLVVNCRVHFEPC